MVTGTVQTEYRGSIRPATKLKSGVLAATSHKYRQFAARSYYVVPGIVYDETMTPDPRSRRDLLRGGGAVLAVVLGGGIGKAAGRLRSHLGARPIDDSGEPDDGRPSVHDVAAVCYNRGDDPREVVVRVSPADTDATRSRSVTLDGGESARLQSLLEEPVDGTIPHEVTATTGDGAKDSETVVANAVHDLHGLHVIVDEDGVGVRAVSH